MGWSDAGDKFKNPWKKQKNRLPAISVSAMDNLTQGFNFVVSMNAFTYGFKEVSGIEIENHVESIPEGGVNDHPLVVGVPNSGNIGELSFKRGLIMRSPSLISDAAKAAAAVIPINLARRAALIAINALDPQESLESGPSLGTIQVYSRTGELTGLYNFVSVGLKSWKIDDLSATDDSVLIEEITIYHTGITRMPVTIVPALFVPSSYNDDRNAWDADAAAERWKKAQESKENEKKVQAQIMEEAKERREESDEKKLDAEMQKMLDEARKILGDDFDKFAGDLQTLLNGQGSIEEKLERLEEEKVKLKDEIDKYYNADNIDKRNQARQDYIDSRNEEQTRAAEEKAAKEREEESKRKEELGKERAEQAENRDNVEDTKEEKRKEQREARDKKIKEEAEQRAAEAREKAEKRKEELEKIRAEQADNRNRVEEAKNQARQDYIDSRNEEQTRAAEEKAAKEREEEKKRKEENAKQRQEQDDNQ